MQINKVLILGAGAIGQVIGTHLRLSGCDVTYWIRPDHISDLEQGVRLYNVKKETELTIAEPKYLTEIEDTDYDALFLCVRSEQIDAALEQVKTHFGEKHDLVVVVLQPGREDAIKAFQALPEMIIVPGAPSFFAYFEEQKVIYWAPKQLPTLMGAPFNETLHVRDEIVRLFNHGGIPTKGVNDLEAEVRFPSVGLNLLLAGFALSGYSLSALQKNQRLLDLCARAIQEGMELTRKDLGFIPIKYLPLTQLNGKTLQTLFWVLEKSPLFVFMQTMWGIHARKISVQTRQNIDDLLALSLQQGQSPPAALTALSAMTANKIDDYLRQHPIKPKHGLQKDLIKNASLAIGSIVLWKWLTRKKS